MTPQEREALELWGAERAADIAAQAEPGDGDVLDDPNFDPAVELWRLSWQRRSLEESIAATVAQARERGQSWNTIGRAMGVTAEAARKRYKDQLEAS